MPVHRIGITAKMEILSKIRRNPHKAAHPNYQAMLVESPVKDGLQTQGRSSLGWNNVLIFTATLLGCTLGILVAAVYLTLLWFRGPTKAAWTLIILSNWTATSVAICGVAIRWASTAQMILCTSILSWNMLQRGSQLSKIPRLSSLRYSNGGPWDFVYLLSWRPKYGAQAHLFVVISLSICNTVMLQLSSTLLLSDLAAGSVESFQNSTESTIFSANRVCPYQSFYYTDTLMSTSPSFPLFAEYSPANWSQHIDTVDDTGPVVRALLPVSTEMGRSKLLSFDGNATLYDARWICTSPIFTNLSLVGTPPDRTYLTGRVEHSEHISPMTPAGSRGYIPYFNCSVPTSFPRVGWTLLTCDPQIPGAINSLDSVSNSSELYAVSQYGEFQYGPNATKHFYNSYSSGVSWLVLNVTNFEPDSVLTPYNVSMRIAFNDTTAWTTTSRGPWARLSSTQKDGMVFFGRYPDVNTSDFQQPSNWTFELDVSLCASAFSYTKSMYINARRDEAVEEPVSLTGALSQIGALRSSQTHAERGVMTLNKTELDRQLSIETATFLQNKLSDPVLPISDSFDFGTRSGALSNRNRAWYEFVSDWDPSQVQFLGVNEDRANLMQNIIQDTGSPALAMQSMQHTIITDRFYKYLPICSDMSTLRLTYSIDAIQPVRNRGFIAVMVSICIHFLLVTYIVTVFGMSKGAMRTMRSVNQAWQVYRQVAYLQDELAQNEEENVQRTVSSTTATDHEVETSLKHRGLNDSVYVLENTDGSDHVEFRLLEKPDHDR